MFLRHTKRKKDGKEHRYWSIVENRRIGGDRVVQRPPPIPHSSLSLSETR